jgi:hypothetical protein
MGNQTEAKEVELCDTERFNSEQQHNHRTVASKMAVCGGSHQEEKSGTDL